MSDVKGTIQPPSIEQQIQALPPLPDTVAKVMAVVDDPESSANDLMKAILPDQPMCLAILRLANSAYYGRQAKVNSIEKAITVLGFSEVQNIVLGKAALSAFKPVIGKYQHALRSFWDHAFTCGLAAKNIAEQLNQQPGPFFMAGLLHDLGKLALLLTCGDRYQPEQWLQHLSTVDRLNREKDNFKLDHATIGGIILKKWEFPASLVIALQHHHAPQHAPALKEVAYIVQLADFLSHMYELPERPNEQTLKARLQQDLPEFESSWKEHRLPWQDVTLETWLAFLKVDRDHGSAVLDILAA